MQNAGPMDLYALGIQTPCYIDDDWGVQSPKRKVLRFHETILSFGEPGSLGNGVMLQIRFLISKHVS